MRVTLLAMLLALAAGALSAQASLNVSGSVSDNDEFWYFLDIDFGGGLPTSATIDVSINATGGSSGLEAWIVDLDAAALYGYSSTSYSGSDPGMGTISLSRTSAAYSGVTQFALVVGTDSGDGTSPFAGTVSSVTLAAGAITVNNSAPVPWVANEHRHVFNQFTRWELNDPWLEGEITEQREITVDFGAVPQAVTFNVWTWDAGFGDASLEVYEIDAGGTPQLLSTLGAGSFWYAGANLTTSARSGAVTIRMVLTTIDNTYFGARWTAETLWPSGTTVLSVTNPPYTIASKPPAGSGKAGDNDVGCTAGVSSGASLLLLSALAMVLAVVLRLRRD